MRDEHHDILALLGLHPQADGTYPWPKGVHVDHSHDVVSGADSTGHTVYIDRHIPPISRSGMPLWPELVAHELDEGRKMNEGEGYKRAHMATTEDEKKKANALGFPWRSEEETIRGYLSHIEHEKVTRPPKARLHVSPRVADRSK